MRRVIDGDTVQLSDGRFVRYLGVDTPELRRRVRPSGPDARPSQTGAGGAGGEQGTGTGEDGGWVWDPEPFGEEAAAFNRELVEGRQVQLEFDVRTRDRFGRLLAYVYVDGVMVNAQLLRAGLAEPRLLAPNVKYAASLLKAAADAQASLRGLWGGRAGESSLAPAGR